MIQIGPYQLSSVMTGAFALDGGAMFGVIPKTLWAKKINVDDKNRIDMRTRSLLIRGGGKVILVDTGIGGKSDEKFRDIYRVDHSEYSLEKGLAERGVGFEEITDVVTSHLHFDHAGGSTVFDASGCVVPAFPDAKYHIQKRQYDWALSAGERERASFRRADFEPVADAGLVEFHDGPYELYPGISVKLSFGHTEAQQHVIVSEGRETLFYCADMIPTSIHVPLPWIMAYDVRPLVTLEEKKEILPQAAEEGWILFFEHCPYVAAAHVRNDDGKYEIGDAVDL